MEEDRKKLIDDNIVSDLNNIMMMCDEKERAQRIENISKLYDLKLKEEESEIKKKAEADRRKDARADKIIKIVGILATTATGVLGIILPLKHYDRNFIAGLEYEKEGVISSTTVKGLFNKQNPYR